MFSIPSKLELSEEVININNPNFHPVKLRIMTSGKNWNISDFNKEGMPLAKDTLSYAPILANIIEREDGELDANGHDVNMELTVDYNGNMNVKETYIERPVGVFINNASELKVDEEDSNKTYIEAYGYLWKIYSDMYEVLKRDEIKDVSVEIEVVKGQYRESDGYYQIDEWIINGCTVLGNSNLPAIDKSNIEFNFSREGNKEYFENLEILKNLLNQKFSKEGEIVENEVNNNSAEQVEEQQNNEQNFTEEEFAKCDVCGEDPCVCEDDSDDDTEEMKKKKRKCSEDEEEKKYSQSELDAEISKVREEYESQLVELNSLREFKAEVESEKEKEELSRQVEEVFSKFDFKEDEVSELREKFMKKELDVEILEEKLCALAYKKNYSKKDNKEEKQKEIKVSSNGYSEEISPIDALFERYGIKKNKN